MVRAVHHRHHREHAADGLVSAACRGLMEGVEGAARCVSRPTPLHQSEPPHATRSTLQRTIRANHPTQHAARFSALSERTTPRNTQHAAAHYQSEPPHATRSTFQRTTTGCVTHAPSRRMLTMFVCNLWGYVNTGKQAAFVGPAKLALACVAHHPNARDRPNATQCRLRILLGHCLGVVRVYFNSLPWLSWLPSDRWAFQAPSLVGTN